MPIRREGNIVLFYGLDAPFSNMFRCKFVDPDTKRQFNCVEQFYQYNKVMTFGQTILGEQIMAADSPVQQKRLGGTYFAGFKADTWNSKRFEIMFYGNMYKYTQNAELMKMLLDTGVRTLGEASSGDLFWGTGIGLRDPGAFNVTYWAGQNQMGLLLKNIRYWQSQSITKVHKRHEII